MQLSKLEIKGFKSFPDKITIHFDKGITGIVGPNGCGKSNIVDAIRWVLGEQRISVLRSEKMENIIFNGAQKRAALQMAEASLTIDNTKNIIPTEYAQITITRRLYRSGESEYLLNNVACRLKDITNLLLDTGISSNNYAIIELSMVDDLLTDRENTRKHLFDEAAGIAKFKKRKRETLRKIEATEGDLERVEDILFEIKKNMKSLEKQAKQASTYYKIKKEYRTKSIQLAQTLVSSEQSQQADINKKIALRQDEKAKLTASRAALEATLETHKKNLLEKERLLSQEQQKVNEHADKVRHYENEKKIKNERLHALREQVTRLNEQVDEERQSRIKLQEDVNQLHQKKETAQNQLVENLEKANNAKQVADSQKRTVAALHKEAEGLKQRYHTQQSDVHQLSKELDIRAVQIHTLKQEAHNTHTDVDKKQEHIVDFENELSALKKSMTEKNTRLEELLLKEKDTANAIATLEKEREATREKMTAVGRKLDAHKNEYRLTQSLIDNMEGFSEAIKFVKKNVDWAKKAPLLLDVISTPEAYRVTIENYLEPYLNYYISPSREDALKAIDTLAHAGKGKAHFFILNALEGFIPSSVRQYENAFPAIEVVEFDRKYTSLMRYLFDGVYLHTGDINRINAEEKSVFITPEGTLTKKRFSLSGGSTGLFEGKKIGRQKRLEELGKEIDKLALHNEEIQRVWESQQVRLNTLRDTTHRQNIEVLQQEIKTLNDKRISIETKKEHYINLVSTAGERTESLRKKIHKLEEEAEAINRPSQKAVEALNQIEQKLTQIGENLKVEDEKLSQHRKTVDELHTLFQQQENIIASTEQEINFKKESMDQSSLRIERSSEKQETINNEIKDIIARTAQEDRKLLEMYAQKEHREKDLNELEKAYYACRQKGEELNASMRDIQRQREGSDTALMELKEKLNGINLHLSAIRERLSVEFKVELDETTMPANAAAEGLPDAETLRDQIERIKNRMEKIEPINPMAMEAYNEIKERNNFIIEQKEDLIKAKDKLLNTVEEIEKVASETFMKAFEKIKEHFKNVFESLFHEGDECDLTLTHPAHLLESRIEIIAKPKGKRPLTINQLSGGEKTLTAIALLFSIYLLKPAPFCIFDEVDAPLDDANIDKFNKIIRNFSEQSQFIVVTHNKRTMISTDIIYGITMIEKGVSKAVAVNLKEFEQMP